MLTDFEEAAEIFDRNAEPRRRLAALMELAAERAGDNHELGICLSD